MKSLAWYSLGRIDDLLCLAGAQRVATPSLPVFLRRRV